MKTIDLKNMHQKWSTHFERYETSEKLKRNLQAIFGTQFPQEVQVIFEKYRETRQALLNTYQAVETIITNAGNQEHVNFKIASGLLRRQWDLEKHHEELTRCFNIQEAVEILCRPSNSKALLFEAAKINWGIYEEIMTPKLTFQYFIRRFRELLPNWLGGIEPRPRFREEEHSLIKTAHSLAELQKNVKMCWRNRTNINALDKDGYTALHIAILLEIKLENKKALIEFLCTHGANVNGLDKNGLTPLHYAVSTKNKAAIEFLCSNGANINGLDNNGLTPVHKVFSGRSIEEAVETINLMINQSGAQIQDEGLREKVDMLLGTEESKARVAIKVKKRKRENKKKIMSSDPLAAHSSTEFKKPTPAIAISCSIYCEKIADDERMSRFSEQLISRLEECSHYATAPITAPLLAVLAVATLGEHDKRLESMPSEPKNPLKILFTRASHVGDLSVKVDYYFTEGAYITPHHNSLFAALNDYKNIPNGISILFHESAHFIADEVMKNGTNPYPVGDKQLEERYKKIVEQAKVTLSNLDLKSDSLQVQQVVKGFKDVFFKYYPQEDHGLELFAHVTQTIGELGYQEGEKLLKTYFPDLLEFYLDYFNPACMQYLKNHNAQQFLELDESFCAKLDVLKATPDAPILFKNGITPLHINASKGNATKVEALCKNSANVDAADENGFTALYIAVLNGHTEVVKALCRNGADVHARNKRGLTPLNVAYFKGYTEIANILSQHA